MYTNTLGWKGPGEDRCNHPQTRSSQIRLLRAGSVKDINGVGPSIQPWKILLVTSQQLDHGYVSLEMQTIFHPLNYQLVQFISNLVLVSTPDQLWVSQLQPRMLEQCRSICPEQSLPGSSFYVLFELRLSQEFPAPPCCPCAVPAQPPVPLFRPFSVL